MGNIFSLPLLCFSCETLTVLLGSPAKPGACLCWPRWPGHKFTKIHLPAFLSPKSFYKMCPALDGGISCPLGSTLVEQDSVTWTNTECWLFISLLRQSLSTELSGKEDREDNAHLVKYTVHHGSRLWHHGNQSVQHKKTFISLIKISFFFLHLHISNNRPQILICDTLTLWQWA